MTNICTTIFLFLIAFINNFLGNMEGRQLVQRSKEMQPKKIMMKPNHQYEVRVYKNLAFKYDHHLGTFCHLLKKVLS